ncbi:MAG: hypothetical protein R3191_07455, partial [Anaerolineales bacterium]|nr:hypothetical protein [Anaerolineales bacterium]
MSPFPNRSNDQQPQTRSSRWQLALATLITLALACSLGGPSAADDAGSAEPVGGGDGAAAVPTFARGVNMSPAGFPNDYSQLPAFYDEVASIPDAAVQWNGAWREDVASGTDAGQPPQPAIGLLTEARSHGLLPVVVFGWRSGSNLYLRVPGNSTNNWSNADACQLYAQMLADIARQHQPPYILLGNENDFYFEQAPDDYENWIAAYGEAYSAIKRASPDTRVGP